MTLEFDVSTTLGSFEYDAAFEANNEIVVLFGHSGAGKSLTLQFVAGLLRPARGRIALGGEVLFDSAAGVNLPPQRRRVGYVVQELALFEHLSVAENIAFGVPAGVDRRRRTEELLALLGLEGFGDRRPRTLSGGQRQRVALARAIARDAPLLLLDEPFSALDDSLRVALRKELIRLRNELGLTILFVTHDLREAHFLADRIAVFDNGRILQIGPRGEVFKRPASRRVAELTGVANIWRGEVAAVEPGFATVMVDGFRFRAECASGSRFACGQEVDVMVRAERVNLRRPRQPLSEGPNQLTARVASQWAYGATHSLHLQPVETGPDMEVEIAARPYEVLGIEEQKEFVVEIEPGDLHIVPADPDPGATPG
ncbi:MAG: ABC transporter ATP-binding protein [Hyphomicrobiales bacterium]